MPSSSLQQPVPQPALKENEAALYALGSMRSSSAESVASAQSAQGRLGSTGRSLPMEKTTSARSAVDKVASVHSTNSRGPCSSWDRGRRPSIGSNSSLDTEDTLAPIPDDLSGIRDLYDVVVVGTMAANVADVVSDDITSKVMYSKNAEGVARLRFVPVSGFQDELPLFSTARLPATAFLFVLELDGGGDPWEDRLSALARRVNEVRARCRFSQTSSNIILMPVFVCAFLTAADAELPEEDKPRIASAQDWAKTQELDMLMFGAPLALTRERLRECFSKQLLDILSRSELQSPRFSVGNKKKSLPSSRPAKKCGCCFFKCFRSPKARNT